MTDTAPDRFDKMLGDVCDGTFDVSQAEELIASLNESPANCQAYLDHLQLRRAIWLYGREERVRRPALAKIQATLASPPAVPAAHSFAATLHGTVDYFSSGWPLAYLITSVVFAVGLAVGYLTPATTSHTPAAVAVRQANQSTSPKQESSADVKDNTDSVAAASDASSTKRKIVGRITGEVDCSWRIGLASGERKLPVQKTNVKSKKQSSALLVIKQGADAPRSPVSVAFGDHLTIASGLLEITYDTGAKVILQGPCRFNVETNGGFLAIGRLTGKMEKRGEGRGTRGEGVGNRLAPASTPGEKVSGGQLMADNAKPQAASDGKSLATSHQPLATSFVIATPTAIVTDIGTEFGVAVDERRMCHVETFVGLVSVTPISADASKTPSKPTPLTAGQSLSVSHGGVITKTHSAAVHFARRMVPQPLGAYAKAVLDDKPLAYWQLNEPKYAAGVVDRSGHHATGRLRGATLGAAGVSMDRPLAAEFSGVGYIETDELPAVDFAQGYTIEAWVRLEGGDGTVRCPLAYQADRDGRCTGFALSISSAGRWTCPACTGDFWASVAGPPAAFWQWTHVVATFSPTKKLKNDAIWGIQSLYIDGQLVAHAHQPWMPAEASLASIGARFLRSTAGDFFTGRVADAAIYSHALDAERVRVHWALGHPPEPPKIESQKRKSDDTKKLDVTEKKAEAANLKK